MGITIASDVTEMNGYNRLGQGPRAITCETVASQDGQPQTYGMGYKTVLSICLSRPPQRQKKDLGWKICR